MASRCGPVWQSLSKRTDFLAAAKGRRYSCDLFTLQAHYRGEKSARSGVYAGFTVTKKLGCAVIRNRIKRRLRPALTEAFATNTALADLDWDIVIIARYSLLKIPFDALVLNLRKALSVLVRKPATEIRISDPDS
jgi:ribonuclease P protein component